MYRSASLSLSFLILFLSAATAVEVTNTRRAVAKKTGLSILEGQVVLPAQGWWSAKTGLEAKHGLAEIYLRPDTEALLAKRGERQSSLQDRRHVQARLHQLLSLADLARRSARQHGHGVGPANWEEAFKASPKLEFEPEKVAGVHLIPNVRLLEKRDDRRMVGVAKGEVFIIDTEPAIDDGKHWVIESDRTSERREIDMNLMEKLGLTVKPKRPRAVPPNGEASQTLAYTIYARQRGEPGKVAIPIINSRRKADELTLHWDTGEASEGDQAICQAWARGRLRRLSPYLRSPDSLAGAWWAKTARQYQVETPFAAGGFEDLERTADAMGVLGGRAAIRETLQLQELPQREGHPGKRVFPVANIPGVEVEAHPFEEMLAGREGGRLELAEWVPHDRFLVYFPKTEGLFSLMEGGSDFVFASGATMAGRSASHHLKERYIERIGLSEALLRQFLKAGAVEEMALTAPDLFFIDGTEVTVIMRTGKPLLTTTALALVGVPPGEGTTVKKNRRGEPVYWSRRGKILIISTHEKELAASLQAKAKGTGLGQSAELRYMLTQLPLTAETVFYVYFSDPFIRRLVSPAVKIGQLRRLQARVELEGATAGALLAKFDGHDDQLTTNLPFLQSGAYMTKPVTVPDLSLSPNGLSHSELFGEAGRLHSLWRRPVDKVSPQEKGAYEQYLAAYNRYWRRFFDPIAVRYEKHAGGKHQLETFILPLIENSLYDSLREMLPSEEEGAPLQVPLIDPKPVALLSLNLREEAWLELMDDFADGMQELLGLDPSILDLVGPDLHLAVQDADPIIAIGSGELSELFGQLGGRDGLDMWLPMVSVLTRPCTIQLGLQDPDEVRSRLLEMAVPVPKELGGMDFVDSSLHKVTGKDRWILRLSFEGLLTLRFGIEVQDRYLVINNMPFSNEVRVRGHERAPNESAYLTLNPAAGSKQAGSLFSSAAEKARDSALESAASLWPLMMVGAADVAAAQKQHLSLFGFEPLHPGEGTWRWENGDLVSSLYGSVWSLQRPAFDPEGKALGIMGDIAELGLSMQFERDGLRSTVEWRLRPAGGG